MNFKKESSLLGLGKKTLLKFLQLKLNKLFYFLATYSKNDMNIKLNENAYEHSSEDDDEKEDAKFVSRLRLLVGGLFLPTVAISIDKMFLSRCNLSNSVLVRTAIVTLKLFL